MSAASRAREEEQRKKLEAVRYADLPSSDSVDEPDPEFDRLMAWFVENREGLAEHHSCRKVIVDCNEGILMVGKRYEPKKLVPAMTIKYGSNGELIK